MTTHTLAVSGSVVKPRAAKYLFGQVSRMRHDLKQLFARRLEDELNARGISANGLARISGVGQRSISRILRGEQDPTLGMVDAISQSLGLTAVAMLAAAGRQVGDNIASLPSPYPPVFAAPPHVKKSQVRRRKRE